MSGVVRRHIWLAATSTVVGVRWSEWMAVHEDGTNYHPSLLGLLTLAYSTAEIGALRSGGGTRRPSALDERYYGAETKVKKNQMNS